MIKFNHYVFVSRLLGDHFFIKKSEFTSGFLATLPKAGKRIMNEANLRERSRLPLNHCDWCANDPLYVKYHDEEWGVPVYDDRTHFEFLILEGAQAGLSWITILKRRDGYRKAYDNFDAKKVAKYGEDKIQEMLLDPGIIRNKLKVRASVKNAQSFLDIQEEFGSFNNYIWAFVDGKPIVNSPNNMSEVPATSPLSDAVSKDLKKRGMSFVGSTIIYAYLQATGIINDHVTYCFKSLHRLST